MDYHVINMEQDKSLKYIINDLTNEDTEDFDFFASLMLEDIGINHNVTKWEYKQFCVDNDLEYREPASCEIYLKYCREQDMIDELNKDF